MLEKELEITAKTVFGLEEILKNEIIALGGKKVKAVTRAVSFIGDLELVYKCNLHLRTAISVLVKIDSFQAFNERRLYKGISNFDWTQFLDVNDTFVVSSSVNSRYFDHSHYVKLKVKDAIADQFMEKFGERPSVAKYGANAQINIRISENHVDVSLNSSGEHLFKRGYREETNDAPINEVLAAGLIKLAGWKGNSNFIDPMCGSGTLLIEAALIANNIAPCIDRKDFGFMHWKNFDQELWDKVYGAAKKVLTNKKVKIIGSDIDATTVRKAKINISNSIVADAIEIREGDLADYKNEFDSGIVICNPPYGERLDNPETLSYKFMGDAFKQNFSGFDCWVISSNLSALKNLGLRPSRKIKVFNGALECSFRKFEMYRGTKKIHKLEQYKNQK